jgi:hypothetical protein
VKAVPGRAPPIVNLHLLLVVFGALHGASAVGDVAFERGLRFRRSRRCKHEAKAQRAFMLEQRRHLILVAGRNKPRRRNSFFEILDDVIALDVHSPIMDEHRHQPARIDAEKPRLHVLVTGQINWMRLPWNLLEVEEDTKLLRAGRADEMEHVHALPAEHLAGPDVAIDELNH